MTDNSNEVQRQLDAIRKSVRHTRILCLGLALVLIAISVLAAQAPTTLRASTVVAEEILLVNEDGVTIAELATRLDLSGSHGLFLKDDQGRDLAMLRMYTGKHPELSLEAPSHTRLRVFADEDNWGFNVFDVEGKARLELGCGPDNRARVEVLGTEEK